MIIEPKAQLHRLSRYYTTIEPLFAKPVVRAYTMLILSLFTMSFFGYFAIRPTLGTITNLQRQITDASYVDQKLQEKINALSEAQVEYEKIKPELEIIFNALPKEGEFSSFVKTLEKTATGSGISITDLSFQSINLSSLEATEGAKETPVGFTIILSGSYLNLNNFIQNLALEKRLVTLEKMGFNHEKEKEELNLDLNGQTYYVQ